jgi:DNA-directed RNA polymerase subunit RPC12/RpoP
MTSETRTFVQAHDIEGVEVECPKCQLTIFYPIAATEKTTEILAGCPHCSHRLFDDTTTGTTFRSQNFPAIIDLQKIASGLRALVRADRTDIHAGIRFRVGSVSGKP